MNKSNKTLIKSITISGILILALLLNTSSINQTFAKKDNKISKEDNVGQNVADNQANHCKASMKLSAQWYSPYRTLMIRGTLTCGNSGLDGKTIVLTSSKLSYVGKIATVVTTQDGSFYKSYKTNTPLTTISAWYLGGPDQGGIASKVIKLGPCPWCGTQQKSSNTQNTPQQDSNTQNAVKENSNAVNTPQEKEVKKPCVISIDVAPNKINAPSYQVAGKLTCGGSGLKGATITFTNLYSAKIRGLSDAVTRSDGTYIKPTTAWSESGHGDDVVARYAGDNEHMPTQSKIFRIDGTNLKG